jgi:hypothetical protein
MKEYKITLQSGICANVVFKPGDCFVVNTGSKIASLINWGQKVWSFDHKANMNHAGIIVDSDGGTFESLERIDHYNLDQYIGMPMLIIRYREMTEEKFKIGYEAILKYDGCVYPFWRFFSHLMGFARFIHWSYPVCSELVGLFLNKANLEFNTGWGTSPDYWCDWWNVNKNVDIICSSCIK